MEDKDVGAEFGVGAINGELCKCGKNPATELHPCPYAVDVNGDYETLCACCVDCENECADEI